MVNQKRSGTDFERKITKFLNRFSKYWKWKRIAGSGAIGTNLSEPGLMGDVVGQSENVPFKIKVEAKFGYGGSKQITIKKEWLDKITEEASFTNDIPVLMARFKGSKRGVTEMAILNLEDFIQLIDWIAELHNLEV